MAQKTVTINFHGILGDSLPKKTWNLAVKSVSEAMHAVEMMSGRQLYKKLYEFDKQNIMYALSINNKPFKSDVELKIDEPKTILESELCFKKEDLETIDIVPVIAGAGDNFLSIFTVILGVALIFTGVGGFAAVGVSGMSLGSTWGTVAVFAGLGLLAAGVSNLLTSPPKFEDFREIAGGGPRSYLFNGPQNTIREGGPVPVGYGRLIVGSQVISSTYEIENVAATGQAIPTTSTATTGEANLHPRSWNSSRPAPN